MSEPDNLYTLPLDKVGSFEFDEEVVRVFPDMINRSVPGYASILAMIGELSSTFAVENSNIYDLGCSLGAATFVVKPLVPTSCRIIAIDSSQAMIDSLQQKLHGATSDSDHCPVDIHCQDINDSRIERASFSILNFTLQFVPPSDRFKLLESIASGTLDGGALVLSEKIVFDDPDLDRLMIELHHNFKRAHGYSDLEIAQKRTALENRLIPETLATHIERLNAVGFTQVTCWFQCFNFVSILAVK